MDHDRILILRLLILAKLEEQLLGTMRLQTAEALDGLSEDDVKGHGGRQLRDFALGVGQPTHRHPLKERPHVLLIVYLDEGFVRLEMESSDEHGHLTHPASRPSFQNRVLLLVVEWLVLVLGQLIRELHYDPVAWHTLLR